MQTQVTKVKETKDEGGVVAPDVLLDESLIYLRIQNLSKTAITLSLRLKPRECFLFKIGERKMISVNRKELMKQNLTLFYTLKISSTYSFSNSVNLNEKSIPLDWIRGADLCIKTGPIWHPGENYEHLVEPYPTYNLTRIFSCINTTKSGSKEKDKSSSKTMLKQRYCKKHSNQFAEKLLFPPSRS